MFGDLLSNIDYRLDYRFANNLHGDWLIIVFAKFKQYNVMSYTCRIIRII